MKAKTILSYLLVLILGGGVGFFVGNSLNSEKQSNKSKNEILKAEDYLEWTHIDLLKYFQSRGFDFKAEKTDAGSFWGTPMDYKNENGEILYVRLHETSEKAQNKASGLGTQGFSWGKFMFKSDNEELLKNISSILDNKFNDDFDFLKSTVTASVPEETQSTQKEQGKITDKIKLENVSTGYFKEQGIWLPRVVLTFKNISNQDITDYIAAEVVFFDEAKKEQLSARKRYPVGGTRLAAGSSNKLHFDSDVGWSNVIPFGKKITAKIYIQDIFIKTVEIDEFEINSLGERPTMHGF